MTTLGERLRQRRAAKGLSLEEVSRATKIHINVLTLIETDRAGGAVSPIYLKGFVKTYGGYLGEDVPTLLALLPPTPAAPTRLAPAPASARRSERPRAAARAAAITQTVAGGLRHLPWRRMALAAAVVALVWVAGTRLRATMARAKPAAAPVKRAAAPVKPTAKPATVRKPAATTTPAIAAPTPKKAQAQPAARSSAPAKRAEGAAEPVRLTMHVHAMTWMQVKADGVVITQQVLQPGARETWLARREIVLWLGDGGGVSLELNGRPLGAAGKRGEVVRNLRITAAGIQR